MKYVLMFVLLFFTLNVHAGGCGGAYTKAKTSCKAANAVGQKVKGMSKSLEGKGHLPADMAAGALIVGGGMNAKAGASCEQAAQACVSACSNPNPISGEPPKKKKCKKMAEVGSAQKGAGKEQQGKGEKAKESGQQQGSGMEKVMEALQKMMEKKEDEEEEAQVAEASVEEPVDKAVTGDQALSRSTRSESMISEPDAEKIATDIGGASDNNSLFDSENGAFGNDAGVNTASTSIPRGGAASSNTGGRAAVIGNKALSGKNAEGVGGTGVTTSDGGFGSGSSASAGGLGGDGYSSESRAQVASVIKSNLNKKAPVGFEQYKKRKPNTTNLYNDNFSKIKERYRRYSDKAGFGDEI